MIKLNKYDSLYWEEYQGKQQLTVGYQDKSGKLKCKWIKQEFGKGNWKDVPFRIVFDSKEEAVEGLKKMIGELQSPF